jgi:hypothetical protein
MKISQAQERTNQAAAAKVENPMHLPFSWPISTPRSNEKALKTNRNKRKNMNSRQF